MTGHLSSAEVLAAIGGRLTYRQLDYWARSGVFGRDVATPGLGGRRCFPTDVVDAIAAACDVAELGANLTHRTIGVSTEILTAVYTAVRSRPIGPGDHLEIDRYGQVHRPRLGEPAPAGARLVVPLQRAEAARCP